MIERMLYLYAESPVHAGGADGAGVVDDPIQREITTKYPVIWGQSLKGALRSLASVHLKNDDVVRLFGTEVTSAADKTRGSITVGDAQIVAFPVPTVVNSFAWATSTLALSKLNRKLVQVDSSQTYPAVPIVQGQAIPTTSCPWSSAKDTKEIFGVCTTSVVPQDQKKPRELTTTWANFLADNALPDLPEFTFFNSKMKTSLVVLADDDFDANVQFGTEVSPRVALDENKNVRKGHLFFVEYLPVDSLLAAQLTFSQDEDAQLMDELFKKARVFQLGGDETVGKGLLWARMGGAS